MKTIYFSILIGFLSTFAVAAENSCPNKKIVTALNDLSGFNNYKRHSRQNDTNYEIEGNLNVPTDREINELFKWGQVATSYIYTSHSTENIELITERTKKITDQYAELKKYMSIPEVRIATAAWLSLNRQQLDSATKQGASDLQDAVARKKPWNQLTSQTYATQLQDELPKKIKMAEELSKFKKKNKLNLEDRIYFSEFPFGYVSVYKNNNDKKRATVMTKSGDNFLALFDSDCKISQVIFNSSQSPTVVDKNMCQSLKKIDSLVAEREKIEEQIKQKRAIISEEGAKGVKIEYAELCKKRGASSLCFCEISKRSINPWFEDCETTEKVQNQLAKSEDAIKVFLGKEKLVINDKDLKNRFEINHICKVLELPTESTSYNQNQEKYRAPLDAR